MKFYYCTVVYNEKTKKDDYYLRGKIIIKNNILNIYDKTVAKLSVLIFDNSYWKLKLPEFKNGFRKTPEGFFEYYNMAFGNVYNLVLSENFLKDKHVVPSDDKNKNELIGIFDLNTMTYTIPDRKYRDQFKKDSEEEMQYYLSYDNEVAP